MGLGIYVPLLSPEARLLFQGMGLCLLLCYYLKYNRNLVRAEPINNKLLSVSPSPKHQYDKIEIGYKIGKHVLGWCIIVDRVVMEIIEGFDIPDSIDQQLLRKLQMDTGESDYHQC